MQENTQKNCPCCSGLSYEACCAPYHLGKEAEDALILMRSRYSAYALHQADYIIRTTHPQSPHYNGDAHKWKEEILGFARLTHFERLEILNFSPEGEQASVTFKAHLKQQGHDATFTEKSRFERCDGRWLYLDGKVNS